MSVLVKGMEMPKWCEDCPMITTDCDSDYVCSVLHKYIPMKWKKIENHFGFYNKETYPKPDWCPLIEVPSPHGRLIEEPKQLSYGGLAYISPYDVIGTAKYFYDQVKAMPTIIEAEEV